jgi:hypothetical protein
MRVTQGAVYNNKQDKYKPANVVDRDLATATATPTDNGTGWIKIEIGKTHVVHKIVVYTRFYTNWYSPDDKCVKSEAKFKGCKDTLSNVDVSIYKGNVKQKSCGTLKLTYGLEQSDQIYTLICNTGGDTVKLSKDTGIIAIHEIVVIGTGNPLRTCMKMKILE